MVSYITSRILQGLLVILIISVATFAMMRLMPGDPVMLLLGEGRLRISQEQIDAIRSMWGLDRPYTEQYFVWVKNLISGNFGESIIRMGVPVRQMIAEALPVTAKLNFYALVVALGLAIPAGIVAAVKRNSFFDYTLTLICSAGAAIPNFWLGLMSIILFALVLGWLPAMGLTSWRGWVLPVGILAFEQLAVIARVMRGATIETLSQDYVRTATAKGLSRTAVITRHAVRNALLPVVTVVGFRVAFLLSGTVIIENIFALPGIGRLFVDSVFRLDYQVVQSIVVLFAVLVVVTNILTDLAYAVVNPRIRIR